MSNLVMNTVTIKGTHEDISKIMDQIKESDTQPLSFNRILPMPVSLNLAQSSVSDLFVQYYLLHQALSNVQEQVDAYAGVFLGMINCTCLNKCLDNLTELKTLCDEHIDDVHWEDAGFTERPTALEIGKTYVDNIQKYGHATWYGWRREHWGTKWDASNAVVQLEDPTFDPTGLQTLCLNFETAWVCPIPILKELSRQYPRTTLEIVYQDATDGEDVWFTIKAGVFE